MTDKIVNYRYQDSYLITSTEEQLKIITNLLAEGKLSPRRTAKSYLVEWHAHNWLYSKNLFTEKTKHTDFNSHESIIRLIGYWIIWFITKKLKLFI